METIEISLDSIYLLEVSGYSRCVCVCVSEIQERFLITRNKGLGLDVRVEVPATYLTNHMTVDNLISTLL